MSVVLPIDEAVERLGVSRHDLFVMVEADEVGLRLADDGLLAVVIDLRDEPPGHREATGD